MPFETSGPAPMYTVRKERADWLDPLAPSRRSRPSSFEPTWTPPRQCSILPKTSPCSARSRGRGAHSPTPTGPAPTVRSGSRASMPPIEAGWDRALQTCAARSTVCSRDLDLRPHNALSETNEYLAVHSQRPEGAIAYTRSQVATDPIASPAITISTRSFCARPVADTFDARGRELP